jgi:hypothetical protein
MISILGMLNVCGFVEEVEVLRILNSNKQLYIVGYYKVNILLFECIPKLFLLVRLDGGRIFVR